MAELVPIPFPTLLRRIHREYTRTGAIFDLPKRKFYSPDPAIDLSVISCGNPAANPLGPAAGPHTQLAQNIVLSWLAGARIIELKTVQKNDRLELTRPCIDVATVGYNTEWSQELRLDESAREYVKAAMIIEILKHWLFYSGRIAEGAAAADTAATPSRDFRTMKLDTIFDVSVGYDLAGIQSEPMRRWLTTMKDATAVIDELRAEIPAEFSEYASLPFAAKISDSITLSTFHGTPAGEIERMCEFLMEDMGYHVVVKMNPPMLGRERLEHLLHDTLGYVDIEVNPKAYDVNIAFDDAVAMIRRLQAVALRTKKMIGVKFGNTLEVINKGEFLKDKVQYMSGQPLHVLHLALVKQWRAVFGPEFPVSFSAGVDAVNFPDCVAIGLVPTTTCTDLLRPGGYGRLQQYLVNLEKCMKAAGAATIDEFIVASHQSTAGGTGGRGAAIMAASDALFRKSIVNPRYAAAQNSKPPRKVGSHLSVWDCINCDKCIPVCPNDANFSFDVEPVSIPYNDLEISQSGWSECGRGVYVIGKQHQIGNYADACNECGNCDVFCPEDGGPYIEKPRFFGSVESFRQQADRDGFVLQAGTGGVTLVGRFQGTECELTLDAAANEAVFATATARVSIEWATHRVRSAVVTDGSPSVRLDMRSYFTMAALLRAMLAESRVHFVNCDITLQ